MDISGLESLVRTYPGLSLGIGVYTIANITVLCLAFSERRKRKRVEEKIRFYSEYLNNYMNQHPSMLKDPRIKSAYEESVRELEED